MVALGGCSGRAWAYLVYPPHCGKLAYVWRTCVDLGGFGGGYAVGLFPRLVALLVAMGWGGSYFWGFPLDAIGSIIGLTSLSRGLSTNFPRHGGLLPNSNAAVEAPRWTGDKGSVPNGCIIPKNGIFLPKSTRWGLFHWFFSQAVIIPALMAGDGFRTYSAVE